MTAAGDSAPVLSISADRAILTVRGFIIDGIARLSDAYFLKTFDDSTEAQSRESFANSKAATVRGVDLAETASIFPAGQTREEALWRTLCCNLTGEIPVRRAPAEWAVGWKMALRQYKFVTDKGQIDRASLTTEFVRDFTFQDGEHFDALAAPVIGHSMGRTLCVTSEGRLGNVPRDSAVGDKICIWFGSRVAFVIRESSGERFKLVGECYVHGFMDGEAMEDRDTASLARDFEIE